MQQPIEAAARQLYRIAEENAPGVYTVDDWRERVATDPDDYVPFCDCIVDGGTCHIQPLTKVFLLKTPERAGYPDQAYYSCASHEKVFRMDPDYIREEDFAAWYERTVPAAAAQSM